ncbi:hypothetical protein BC939DRAFT_460380 [Gamsiella multidivaricata]|uniref:uncharacterized protein n=1 Tax=Gamsiella multidivaricata TaxID=101098 RepID=UPI002220E09C|nr:uncharacterized protein BC939DRAFT_460380 [Gamsiella multidivaricata]KAI7819311.1 hypothetical protein BC939DRAFT_460380 [Gamsiella multidivaricata]
MVTSPSFCRTPDRRAFQSERGRLPFVCVSTLYLSFFPPPPPFFSIRFFSPSAPFVHSFIHSFLFLFTRSSFFVLYTSLPCFFVFLVLLLTLPRQSLFFPCPQTNKNPVRNFVLHRLPGRKR